MAENDMLDRLKDLLKKADENSANKCITDYEEVIADTAEYLLAHGVLLPPCKVGDPLWWYSEDDDESDFGYYPAGVYEDPDGVRVLAWDGHEWYVLIEGDKVPIGTQFAFLTREEAERALAERMKANDR